MQAYVYDTNRSLQFDLACEFQSPGGSDRTGSRNKEVNAHEFIVYMYIVLVKSMFFF